MAIDAALADEPSGGERTTVAQASPTAPPTSCTVTQSKTLVDVLNVVSEDKVEERAELKELEASN